MRPRRTTLLLFLIFLLQAVLFLTLAGDWWLKKTLLEKGSVVLKPRPLKPPAKIIQKFAFNSSEDMKVWEEKIFRGKTSYQIIGEEGQKFLSAESQGASSGLYAKIDQKTLPNLYLCWKWKALTFPVKKEPQKLANSREDDFSARIYVVWGSNFFNSNVIEYLWDDTVPDDTFSSSPFSGKVKLFVIQNGKPAEGEGWQSEERNVFDDYKRLFGEEPKRPISAIAIMSDSDNTQTQSACRFGEITFQIREKQEG